MKKFQNMEAIIVVFVLIFVLMVLIPRCRQNPAAAAPETVVAPVATPQPLTPQVATVTPAAPTTATVTPPVTPTVAPAVAAPVAVPAAKISTPEEFQRKLTPKPMASPTKRVVPAAAQEETVAFNPNGGTAAESGNGITFYTVVADVKMRAQPGLDSKIIGKLPKDVAVTYLNVRTDKTQKLTIDNTPYDEPWLKVRTKKGRIGWVYGGTVRAYKK